MLGLDSVGTSGLDGARGAAGVWGVLQSTKSGTVTVRYIPINKLKHALVPKRLSLSFSFTYTHLLPHFSFMYGSLCAVVEGGGSGDRGHWGRLQS